MSTKSKRLSKIELFYIRNNMATLTPAVLAKDLGLPVTSVRKQIEAFNAADKRGGEASAPAKTESAVEQPKPVTAKQRTLGKFDREGLVRGVTSMTEAQAMIGDMARGTAPHICINCHARRKLDGSEYCSVECQDAYKSGAPQQKENKEFFERNKKNIYKIFPDE